MFVYLPVFVFIDKKFGEPEPECTLPVPKWVKYITAPLFFAAGYGFGAFIGQLTNLFRGGSFTLTDLILWLTFSALVFIVTIFVMIKIEPNSKKAMAEETIDIKRSLNDERVTIHSYRAFYVVGTCITYILKLSNLIDTLNSRLPMRTY